MPRKSRGWVRNGCYHVTHRCHGRKFLFRFTKYREYYLHHLFLMKKRYGVDVLDYMVTCNHVHLLVRAKDGYEISAGLRYLHGRIGQWHNGEKGQEGSFWSDRFHTTRIQSGEHLGRCLFYIDLNMVRAGAVKEPSEWKYSAYHEFTGTRKRYRIVNMKRLLKCLCIKDEKSFRKWYLKTLRGKLTAKKKPEQEEFWSKAIAVGDPDWLKERVAETGLKRFRINSSGSGREHYLIGRQI